MKNYKLKIIVTLLAFSLGIASVWAVGGFSYLASLSEQTPSVSEILPQISETLPEQNSAKIENIFVSQKQLRFEDYPVAKIYKGKTAPLKFPEDDLGYKVVLQLAIDNQEVNFAGHYIATSWSCGMWCSVNAFIDVKT